MKKALCVLVVLAAAVGMFSTMAAGASAGPGRVFVVRQVPLPPGCPGYATFLECAEGELAVQAGTTATREVINMNDFAVFANHQRFAYDTFLDPVQSNDFAVEVLGEIVVGAQDLTTTFAVGSDDGFSIEIEGGSFVASGETLSCCNGSTTVTAGNTMFYNGARAYAESYGAFQFDKAGVHSVRLVFFELGGQAVLNFFSARGDQLQGLGPIITLPDPFPAGAFNLVNDPDAANGIRLISPNAGKKK